MGPSSETPVTVYFFIKQRGALIETGKNNNNNNNNEIRSNT